MTFVYSCFGNLNLLVELVLLVAFLRQKVDFMSNWESMKVKCLRISTRSKMVLNIDIFLNIDIEV